MFAVKDAMPGKNYPPMHPNCRSTTVAVFTDDVRTVRTAKDEGGNYYEVPSDMTYKQWEKAMSGLDKNAEFIVKSDRPGQNITKERIAVFQATGAVPPKVQKALQKTTFIAFIVGKEGASQYDYENDILYVAKGAEKTEVIHEIGHMVENKLMLPEKVLQLQKKYYLMLRFIILLRIFITMQVIIR